MATNWCSASQIITSRRHARHALRSRTKFNKSSRNVTSWLGTTCTNPDLLIEEQSAAYRDNQCMIEDTENYSIGKGVVDSQLVVTYKERGAAHEQWESFLNSKDFTPPSSRSFSLDLHIFRVRNRTGHYILVTSACYEYVVFTYICGTIEDIAIL